jgi:glycosyltransferase involved in cell wall biosynthesis
LTDRIRILYVHHGKGIGGAPLSLLYLIRALDRERFSPVAAFIHESEATELFRSEGIETLVVGRIRDFSHTNVLWYPWWQWPKILHRLLHLPFAIERAKRFMEKHPSEIVHLNTSTLLAFGIAAKRLGRKVVWHVREPIHSGYIGLRRRLVRSVIDRNADIVIPISGYDASQLLPSDSIRVVYNFVDFGVFDRGIDGAEARDELGIGKKARMVLMLGGINRVKGTREFVDAALRVLEKKDDVVFCIAGAAPGLTPRNLLNGSAVYERAVRRMIPEGRRSSILFTGVRRDVPRLLAASDIVCFPSTVPHFARPIIEASAMGKPVIASDLGGPKELVEDGSTGILVPSGDCGALSEAMLDLLDHPEKAASMGARGHELARNKYDAVRNSAQVIAIYEQLMRHE